MKFNLLLAALLAVCTVHFQSAFAFKVEDNTLYFNENNLPSDTSGSLPATVLFAQNQIIPSKNTVKDDIQQHLSAYRKTLVMLKPKANYVSVNHPLVMTVKNSLGRAVASFNMAPPEDLPLVFSNSQNKVAPRSFDLPESFGASFSTQQQLSALVVNNAASNLLKEALLNNDAIKISASNGNWVRSIYLPSDSRFEGKTVAYDHKATWRTTLHYSDYGLDAYQSDTPIVLKFKNGRWRKDYFLYQESELFSDTGHYDIRLESFFAISKGLTNESGTEPAPEFLDVLNQHDSILINIQPGAYSHYLILPSGEQYHGKKVVLYQRWSGTTEVHYSGKSARVTGQWSEHPLVFGNVDGEWLSATDAVMSSLHYGKFWSAQIPARFIEPGMSIAFENHVRSSELNDINVGGYTEYYLLNINLGFLTEPATEYRFTDNPEYQRQYFQQLPASRLVVAEYEPAHFEEVVLADGSHYVDAAPDAGGAFAGGMRHWVGKILVSGGINAANHGHLSGGALEADYTRKLAMVVAHKSVGSYRNGRAYHCCSGGNGIVTVGGTIGNEWSHEVGHSLGLGHTMGGEARSLHAPAHIFGSTWGWDADKNRFISNFYTDIGRNRSDKNCAYYFCRSGFNGVNYNTDAMSGGSPQNLAHNAFTLYTPFSANHIQGQYLEKQLVFSAQSKTGFLLWNPRTKKMEETTHFTDRALDFDFKRLLYEAHPHEVATAESISALLDPKRILSFHAYGGHFLANIYIPKATAQNRGSVIRIMRYSDLTFRLHINSEVMIFDYGDEVYFKSDGTKWIEGAFPDDFYTDLQAISKIVTVAQGSTVAQINEHLHQNDRLWFITWNGNWRRTLTIPEASEANKHKVITIGRYATWPSNYRVNGSVIAPKYGQLLVLQSDGSRWQLLKDPQLKFPLKPHKVGVPVTTLLGYYDPEMKLKSFAYPALRGSWGAIYPDQKFGIRPNNCKAVVTFRNTNEVRVYKLLNYRRREGLMNRFNVNVETALSPKKITVSCHNKVLHARSIEPYSGDIKTHKWGYYPN